MKEILKVRRVGSDVILYQNAVYYSEIIIRCESNVTAEKVANRLFYAINDVNSYISGIGV